VLIGHYRVSEYIWLTRLWIQIPDRSGIRRHDLKVFFPQERLKTGRGSRTTDKYDVLIPVRIFVKALGYDELGCYSTFFQILDEFYSR
jgi:hypothetical protein